MIKIKKLTRTERKTKFSPRFRQCYVGLGPILLQISGGMIAGFTPIWISQILGTGAVKISIESMSLITSTVWPILITGCILGGCLVEIIGRKNILIAAGIANLMGWIIIYFSKDSAALSIGLGFTELCLGLMGGPSVIYISETSDPEFRSFLLGLLTFGDILGINCVQLMGSSMTWQNTALASSIFPLVSILIMFIAPDSPSFLAKKFSRSSQAKNAFHFFRGSEYQAVEELNELINNHNAIRPTRAKLFLANISSLKEPEFYKPMLIMLILLTTSQWCGENSMLFYIMVMREESDLNVNISTGTTIINITKLITSFLACFLLMKMNRRRLVLYSGVGTVLSLCMLSWYYFLTRFTNGNFYASIALMFLIAYMIFLTIGLTPLQIVIMGEVFPSENRGLGCCMCFLVYYGLIYSVVIAAPLLGSSLHLHGSFLLHAACCFIGTGLLWKFLPETKNKPLYWTEDCFKEATQS